MPKMKFDDQLVHEVLTDMIYNADAGNTPFSTMVSQGDTIGNKEAKWQVEQPEDKPLSGIPEGKDADDFTARKRYELRGMAQHLREEIGVTNWAALSNAAGVGDAKEMSYQMANGAFDQKRKREKIFLSNKDSADEGQGAAANETRGVAKWLSTTAQDHLPVPDGFRPSADTQYTGALADLDEETFLNLFVQAAHDINGSVTLTGFVGLDLKRKISSYNSYQKTDANKTVVRRVNADESDKTMINVIDRIVTDAGEINLVPSYFGYCDPATGAKTDLSKRCGFFLAMELWKFCHYGQGTPQMRELEDQGGGPRGIIEEYTMLRCGNPLGQVLIAPSS